MADKKENKSQKANSSKTSHNTTKITTAETSVFSTEDMAMFCRNKGFVYTSSEIYGGMKGFFDYGPLGADMKKNLKDAWWKYHVQDREDIVGIDGSIITHPKVWKASGHAENFADVMVEDTKTGEKFRADVLIEDALKIPADGLSSEEMWKIIEENKLTSPAGNPLAIPEHFNLMFTTNVGLKVSKENSAYLRPETAQVIFADFRQIVENARLKLPFGIAQMGKAFRNEISPRNFLFRCREFEQMEIEYFIHPNDINNCPWIDTVKDHNITILSAEDQKSQTLQDGTSMTIGDALTKGIIKTQWHAYWLAEEHRWFISLGAKADNFRIRQHVETEKSHYALDTWDLEYKFPFGWKELQGMANRTDFDLQQHIKHSGKDLSIFDEATKSKIVPYVVAEPSQGVDRAFLVFLYDAYVNNTERGNIVLNLSPKLAPIKVAVLPLINKLNDQAREVYSMLHKEFPIQYDKSGSVGRRYARADEIGIPFCVTVDFDYVEKQTVTIRDRTSTKQIIVHKDKIVETLHKLLQETISFENAGTLKETK
ncbi:MAG: glycine--tRNA ligase [Candidatus Woesearchaeota archaeon]